MKRIIAEVSDKKHKRFKVYCGKKDKTMSEVIRDLIDHLFKK